VFCALYSSVFKQFGIVFLWLNYIVGKGFATLDEKGARPVSFILLSYASTSLRLLELYSPEVVLDIYSCFDTSVYFCRA